MSAVKFTCLPTDVSRKTFNIRSGKTEKNRGLKEEFDNVKGGIKKNKLILAIFVTYTLYWSPGYKASV